MLAIYVNKLHKMFFSVSVNFSSMGNACDDLMTHFMICTLKEEVKELGVKRSIYGRLRFESLHEIIKEVYKECLEQSKKVYFSYALNKT